MGPLRRLSRLVRPRRLLAAGAFLFLGYVFANNLSPEARYTVRTDARVRHPQSYRESSRWATVSHVADDGERISLRIHHGEALRWKSTLELWDVRAGADRTPAHWREPAFQDLLGGNFRDDDTGLAALLVHRAGREFLCSEAAWAAIRDRLTAGGVRFSPDGRYVSYRIPVGRQTDGTAIDDLRTGRRVATLSELTDRLTVAPDGRTGVSPGQPAADGTRRLVLWDLATATRRAELSLPPAQETTPSMKTGGWHRIKYSPDGRYVFADSYQPALVRWWDVVTGQPVGEVVTFGSPGLVPDGREVVVCQPGGPTVEYWPAVGGPVANRWQPDWPAGQQYGGWTFADGRQHALAGLVPERAPPTRRSFQALDEAAEWLSERLFDRRAAYQPREILVLDVIERRTLGRIPGASGMVSGNGRWLATLDADGLVRVWELPVGRPWVRGFAYAAAVLVGVWVLGRLWRRRRGPVIV